MKRSGALIGTAVLLLTLGVGTVSADPTNSKNALEIPMTCDGESVLVVINQNGGAAAHDVDSTRTFVVMGITDHGNWLIPLVPGQAKQDLVLCAYTFPGHEYVAYMNESGN